MERLRIRADLAGRTRWPAVVVVGADLPAFAVDLAEQQPVTSLTDPALGGDAAVAERGAGAPIWRCTALEAQTDRPVLRVRERHARSGAGIAGGARAVVGHVLGDLRGRIAAEVVEADLRTARELAAARGIWQRANPELRCSGTRRQR